MSTTTTPREVTAEQIAALRLRPWKPSNGRGGTRYYLSDWMTLAGFQVDRYNTGNVRAASLNGEPISNTKATKTSNGRAWITWDGQLCTTGPADDYRDAILAGIVAATRGEGAA